jgi:hypothetical protein
LPWTVDDKVPANPRHIGRVARTGASVLLRWLPEVARRESCRTDMPDNYFRFAHLQARLRGGDAFPALDPIEERLLATLAGLWAQEVDVSVQTAMQSVPDASASTVHRRLKGLIRRGLLAVHVDQRDQRVKYLQPTSLTLQYYHALGESMAQAVGNSAEIR